MTDQISAGVVGLTLAFLAVLHPFAAAGAAFGCCFYLAFPSASNGVRRALYAIFSWGTGYAAGIYFHGEGPPFSEKAMLISAGVSAVAVVFFVSIGGVIHREGELPPWLRTIIELGLRLKRGGGNDS